MTTELPLIEKYRPKYFDDVIDHEEKITTLKSLISKNQLPHLLFYGPPGSGKTSLILALAREFYGEDFRCYIMEINGSSERGIDTIRVDVVGFIQNRSNMVKLIILDEADALTGEAQGALKSVMEKYSKFARFCLICNDSTKISPALQSRCTKFVFSCLKPEAIKSKLMAIAESEGIDITESGIQTMILLEKDFRQLLNILQGMHAYYSALEQQIDEATVYTYMGKPTTEHVDLMINALFTKTFNEAYGILVDLNRDNSINVVDMVQFILARVLVLKLDVRHKHAIIGVLSQIDSNIRSGCNTEIQLAYLTSIFLKVRNDK